MSSAYWNDLLWWCATFYALLPLGIFSLQCKIIPQLLVQNYFPPPLCFVVFTDTRQTATIFLRPVIKVWLEGNYMLSYIRYCTEFRWFTFPETPDVRHLYSHRNDKNVGVLPIRIVYRLTFRALAFCQRENRVPVSLWRRANAQNVRLYYPYRQYTDQPFHISICISTLPTQHTTFISPVSTA